jgi:hypothetical protein
VEPHDVQSGDNLVWSRAIARRPKELHSGGTPLFLPKRADAVTCRLITPVAKKSLGMMEYFAALSVYQLEHS